MERRYEPLTDQQLNQLLETISESTGRFKSRDYLLVLLLSRTGMRLSEALTLTTEDINFDDNFIRIRAENTKTRTGRIIYLEPNIRTRLRHYIKGNFKTIQKSEGHIFYSGHHNRDRQTPRRLMASSWSALNKKYLKEAGLYEVKFKSHGKEYTAHRTHNLRKKFAFDIFRKNPNARLNEVAQCTGHKSLSVLANLYIQCNEKDTQKRLLSNTFA